MVTRSRDGPLTHWTGGYTSCGQDGETPGLLISTMCIGKPDSVVIEATAVEG